MKTLVLGGYGNFGARICRALAGDFSNALVVGGRSAQRAQAFANELGHGVHGVGIDLTSKDFPKTLSDLGIKLLIHTAGPFQHQAYGVAQAAALAGAHYIDLSDGRQFVCAFPDALNDTFLTADRTAISGASTVPALSSAVVDYLCKDWQRIDAIDTCIAPAQTAPRGKATLAGVLSYCGEPIRVWVEGQWQSRKGWANPESITFCRLRPRKAALCDIPDLELFPHRYQVSQRVMFRAALEVGFTQYAFAALAALRSGGWIGSPAKLAGLLNSVSGLFDVFGSSLGGMVVRVEGLNAAGILTRREWHIAADDDRGPEIPCMAAILLARRMASGEQFEPGAFTCTGKLELAEFAPEFARWGMLTDILEQDMHRDAQAA